MKKQLLICMSVLSLVACTEENDDIYGVVDPKNKGFYSYDIESARASKALIKKVYQVDKDKILSLTYSETPKLRTEALRNFLTKDEISTILPPQNTAGEYLIGTKVIFNDSVLEYEPYNFGQKASFKLSYQLQKVDLSGLNVADYIRYFMNQASASASISDVTLQIIQNLIFSTQDKFPSGATCWQKQVQLSTQDYIESYPTQNLTHVSIDSNIQNQGVWQNAAWTAFQPNTELNLADTRIRYQAKEHWGFFHNEREVNTAQPNNVLACDFFNESAFKQVDRILGRVF